MRRLLPLGQAVVASAHVTACVFLLIAFLSTGHWVPLAVACTAGVCAWWLLREDDGPRTPGPPAVPTGCGCSA